MGAMLRPRNTRGIVAVRADAGAGDSKKVLAELATAFEEFKAANDERLAKVEKGKADALLDEKVDKINATITDLQSQLSEMASQNTALRLGPGGGNADAEAQARTDFARTVGAGEITPDDYASYRAGLNTYMRRGNSTPSSVLAQMSVGSDPDGGYTVTPDMSGRIAERVYETSPMRQFANVETIGTDAMQGFNDLDEAEAGWVGETEARNDTDTPGVGKWEIPVHEVFAMPKTTQKLLEDSTWDIEGWLSRKVADRFVRKENAAFINGDGELKPRGLLTYPTASTADASRSWGTFEHVNTGTSGGFGSAPAGSDKLIDLVFKMKADHRQNAAWMMARSTVAAIRKLKDGDGNYLWQPNFEARQGGLLLGYPIGEAEDMPAIGANSLSIAFGDFRETYTIIDRVGITVLRDPFTQKGFVKFYTRKRVGGGATHFEAVKFLRFGS